MKIETINHDELKELINSSLVRAKNDVIVLSKQCVKEPSKILKQKVTQARSKYKNLRESLLLSPTDLEEDFLTGKIKF